MGIPIRRRHKVTSADISQRLRQEVTAAKANPREVFGYASYGDRFPMLNRLSAGVHDYSLGVLAARPKVGKSLLAGEWVVPIAEQAVLEDAVVRVITLEMTPEAWQRRQAAQMAQIADPMNVRRGWLTDEEQENYLVAVDWLAALPIEYLSNKVDLTEDQTMVPGNSPVTFDEVASFIRAEGGGSGKRTFWSLLDHIGLLSDLREYSDVTTNIRELANKLSILYRSTASGLVITHLTRASVGSRPSIESIAGSDQVGRNADVIMLLSRPFMEAGDLSKEELDATRDGEVAFLQYISRDEGSGLDILWFDKRHATFREMNPGPGEMIVLPNKKKPGR